MNLQVLLFGPQAELAGRRRLHVEFARASTTADEVLRRIGEAEPKLAPTLPSSRLAVNHAFADRQQPIREGDEVALIGMVSGG